MLEMGTSPEVEHRIRSAPVLVSSRLSLVESCRAFLRLRTLGGVPEERLVDAERDVGTIWSRCELWEISRTICETACAVTLRFATLAASQQPDRAGRDRVKRTASIGVGVLSSVSWRDSI
jgi:hypothetical protein